VGRTDIEVVREVFVAFAARDVERVLALADPEVVFTAVTGGVVGKAEPYRGHEGMREYFRDVADVWDELVLTPGEFRQVGDAILVTGKVNARSPARVVSGSTGWVWRVRDGRVVYGHVFPSAADAIAAVEEEDGSGH
jgi:ketosteroid isomerase-like protein